MLPGEIEIEYESKGRARKRGIKGTRIRKMRRKKALRKGKEEQERSNSKLRRGKGL